MFKRTNEPARRQRGSRQRRQLSLESLESRLLLAVNCAARPNHPQCQQEDGPSLNSDNGHYYEFVEASEILWTDARAAAEARSFTDPQGNVLPGYLATVTSAVEQTFLEQEFGAHERLWLGGSDSSTEELWRWVTGPEAAFDDANGLIFWRGGGTTGPGIEEIYGNWISGEPNNLGDENYLVWNHEPATAGIGGWNDLADTSPNDLVDGYLVEYGNTLAASEVSIDNVVVTEGDTNIAFLGAFTAGSAPAHVQAVVFGPDGNLYVSSNSTVAQVVGGTPGVGSVYRFDAQTGDLIDEFITEGSGGLGPADGIAFDADGFVYVASTGTDEVLRYDANRNFVDAFVSAGLGGLDIPRDLVFGADGNLYVSSRGSDEILRYDGTTGAFIDDFASAGSGGLDAPRGLTFGPDGNLYVSSLFTNQVLRYDGTTGAFIDAFVQAGSGGLSRPADLTFGPGGGLFVSNQDSDNILRFDGATGAFLDTYAGTNAGGLDRPNGLTFGADGNLYVSSFHTKNVLRYGAASQAAFSITLSAPSLTDVVVSFNTQDGSATAASGDYDSLTESVLFESGVVKRTIVVSTNDDALSEGNETFSVNLTDAGVVPITDSTGVATILDDEVPPTPQTKFYVVDDAVDDTYEYQADGTLVTNYNLGSGNNAPRGVAADATGNTIWVIDNDDYVYVYDTNGSLLRSWKALGLSRPEGIASDGEDVWIVDRGNDRVHFFDGGASRTTNTGATSSFSLAAGNPRGITTDGTHLWVVDTGTDDVYKYTVGGSLVGSWALDSRNTVPRGITIDPGNVDNIWVVDSTDDDVYQYSSAATRTTGSQSADVVFSLAAGNTNPQGIADPPAPTEADSVAEPALNAGMALFVEERPVVDRDRDAAALTDLAIPPLAAQKQETIYGPAVDKVMTDMGKPDPGDSDDQEDLLQSLEEAVEELLAAI